MAPLVALVKVIESSPDKIKLQLSAAVGAGNENPKLSPLTQQPNAPDFPFPPNKTRDKLAIAAEKARMDPVFQMGPRAHAMPPVAPSNTKVYPDGSVRTPDGKFAGKTGVIPGTPGVQVAEGIVNARPGWRVVGKEISVRDADGTLRRYDLVAQNPKGEFIGIEVKSGTATRTAQQCEIDASLNATGGFDTVGQRAANAGIDKISGTELIKVP